MNESIANETLRRWRVVGGLIAEALIASDTQPASPLVVWILVAGGIATIGLIVALIWSYEVWALREDAALKIKTIRDYRDAALEGNPAVGAKLVDAYAKIAEDRRKVNAERADALGSAAIACGIAMALIGTELVLAFIAVATH